MFECVVMSELRIKEIKIRVTALEHEALLLRSSKPRLAEWMRSHCLDAPVPRAHTVPKVDPKLLRQLAGMGNNLNQIARAIHSQDWKPVDRVQVVSALMNIERTLQDLKREYSRS